MAKFQQQIFTVGSNSGQAHKNYVDNYDASFGKKKKKKVKKDGENGKTSKR